MAEINSLHIIRWRQRCSFIASGSTTTESSQIWRLANSSSIICFEMLRIWSSKTLPNPFVSTSLITISSLLDSLNRRILHSVLERGIESILVSHDIARVSTSRSLQLDRRSVPLASGVPKALVSFSYVNSQNPPPVFFRVHRNPLTSAQDPGTVWRKQDVRSGYSVRRTADQLVHKAGGCNRGTLTG